MTKLKNSISFVVFMYYTLYYPYIQHTYVLYIRIMYDCHTEHKPMNTNIIA